MRDFFQTILRSIAQGFGFTIGRDVANLAVHEIEEKIQGH